MGFDVRAPLPQPSRRDALRLGIAAGIGLAAPFTPAVSPARAQLPGPVAFSAPPNPAFPLPPTWSTELRELAPGVYAYIQAGGPGRNNVSVSDAGVIVGDDGLMVIDSLTAPMHAKAMVAAIRQVSDKPFRHLINTHHHGDHVNGNQYIDGAEIIGHPYCRDEVLKMVAGPALWQKREGWADGTETRTILPPTTTIEHKVTYHYGKTVVEVFPMLPAHTYGDLVVYLPQHKMLFVGDIGFFYVAPFCQNAHPSNWINVVDQIVDKMDVQTIVPGHGPIGGKQHLAEMGDYLRLLRTEARKRYDARITAGTAAADIRLGKFENWIGPERIIMDTVRFYAEFGDRLTPAVDIEGIRAATLEYNALKAPKA
jgi:glyoxylase-like metal-dependent hydrolase (beta-lactamase superfamily II)